MNRIMNVMMTSNQRSRESIVKTVRAYLYPRWQNAHWRKYKFSYNKNTNTQLSRLSGLLLKTITQCTLKEIQNWNIMQTNYRYKYKWKYKCTIHQCQDCEGLLTLKLWHCTDCATVKNPHFKCKRKNDRRNSGGTLRQKKKK